MTQLYEFMKDKKTMSEFKRRINLKLDSWDDLYDLFTCCHETIKYILQELEKYFSTHLTDRSGSVFLRTSSSSPKDAVENFKLGRNKECMVNSLKNQLSTIKEYMNFLNGFKKYSLNEKNLNQFYNNQNEIFKTIRNSYTNLMKVSSNNLMYAVILILLSKRIRRGFEWILTNNYYHKDYTYPYSHIVLREWVDDVDFKNEFRCFVFKGKLVAVSQYDQHIFHQDLDIELSSRKIINYFNEKIAILSKYYESYVFDVMVKGDDLILIELNPYDYHTSACLFDWKSDSSILYNENPVTVELRSTKSVVRNQYHLWEYMDIIQYTLDCFEK